MMPAQHPIASVALSSLAEQGGSLVVTDHGLLMLASAYGTALAGPEAGAATEALLRVAMFLDVEKKSPQAAGTLLSLIDAAEPVLRQQNDAASAQALLEVEATRAKFSSFQGDERVTKVLASGERPPGTTAAGPMARFQVKVPTGSEKP